MENKWNIGITLEKFVYEKYNADMPIILFKFNDESQFYDLIYYWNNASYEQRFRMLDFITFDQYQKILLYILVEQDNILRGRHENW